jgi:pimeloyl-ACP methyl ester carboxylesterase
MPVDQISLISLHLSQSIFLKIPGASMPFLTINGARLFYELFGEAQAGRPPILLIHGSTATGRSDWGDMAPRLAAAGYLVILPDCRGHGQSENPNLSYSFKEMAADGAALVRALGHGRAHFVGHSNGGNVVLLALMEHPDALVTCIPQAANAYISPDLVEKEPPLFEPERVARDAPQWMAEMQALHGPTHGPDYWRDLLRLTVTELITEPNYTPADLAQVRKPVFVIQGADDTVNATGRHAQYIAEHIPGAQLWLPEGVKHNVHKERPDEWLERVVAFLRRHEGGG